MEKRAICGVCGVPSHVCKSNFDIESEQLTLVDQYLTAQEIQGAREKHDAHMTGDKFFLTRDAEEDAPVTLSPLILLSSERVLNKRLRTDAAEDQEPSAELDNENDETPLSDNSNIHG